MMLWSIVSFGSQLLMPPLDLELLVDRMFLLDLSMRCVTVVIRNSALKIGGIIGSRL